MKNCNLCGGSLKQYESTYCHTCSTFLKWKYPSSSKVEKEVPMKKLSFMWLALFAAMFIIPMVVAIEFQPITPEEQQTFDQMLTPVMKIYNMVKYISSAIAGVVLLVAGIMYMSSGSDPKKRDNAKITGMYVLIGLVVIWAAPLIVNLVAG